MLKFLKIEKLEKFKNSQKGITLIEIIVVIFIIIMFAMILTANFPRILRQSALSRATYKLAQDLRKVQDMGFSGVAIKNGNGDNIKVNGYGIHLSKFSNNDRRYFYIIYADVPGLGNIDGRWYQKSGGNCEKNGIKYYCCANFVSPATADCVIDIIDLTEENPSVFVHSFSNGTVVTGEWNYSIYFGPPNPTVIIYGTYNSWPRGGIILANTDGLKRTVWVNEAGLVYVE